jgi:betaine reductase
VRYGSKPRRELGRDPTLLTALRGSLRSFDQAVAYPPNQAFLGGQPPESLFDWPRPWTDHPVPGAASEGPFGWLVPQDALYGLMKLADDFDLVVLEVGLAARARQALSHLPLPPARLDRVQGVPGAALARVVEGEAGLPLYEGLAVVGFVRQAHPADETLTAGVLLENLACKATAVLALAHALSQGPIRPDQVDFLINSGEEAVGDRYQRGAGSLAKAMGEVVECARATGVDLKAFCASPVYSLITAASLVESGVYRHVVVVGGGSLAKLGMKFLGHLQAGVPVMEDLLASMAFVVGPADGGDPRIRLDSVGHVPIQAGSSAKAVYEALVLGPLDRLGWKMTEVDRYAVELHNPEITLPAGSGDVPRTNYRTLAAMAALRGEIARDDIDGFVRRHGLPGFAPTQGHIPAGVPYLGHARQAMGSDGLRRVMVAAKGSLFLGRMTQLVDGVSFIMEAP